MIIIDYRVHLQLFSWQELLSNQILTVSIFNSFLDKDFCPNRFLPCPSSTLFFTRTFVQTSSYRVHLQLIKDFCPKRFLPCPSLTLSFTRTFVQQVLTVFIFNSFLNKDFCPNKFLPCPSSTLFLTKLLSKQVLTESIFNSFLYKNFCPNKFLPCPSSTLFLTRTFVQPGSASHWTPTRCAVTTEAANKTWRKLNNTFFLLFLLFKLLYFDFFYRNRHIILNLHISVSSKQQ